MGGVEIVGLFKFVDSIGIKIDQLMNKMETSIDKVGEYLDNTIGKKFIVDQQRISSELSKQQLTISKQSESDVNTTVYNESQPDKFTQHIDSGFDNEFKESLDYLGIQLPTDNTQKIIENKDDVVDYEELLEDNEDENQDFLNLILGD